MKRHVGYVTILMVILFFTPIGKAQDATVWGPGDGYEIDYLHSGRSKLNGTTLLEFSEEPRTEFTLQNITNNGYSYIYIGYPEVRTTDNVLLRSFNIPGGEIVIPTGGFPVALPLSYGQKDDFLKSFVNQINSFSQTSSEDEFSSFFNATAKLEDNKMKIKFSNEFNESLPLEDNIFVNLPHPGLENLTGTFHNGTLHANLSYQQKTGVLFDFDLRLKSNNYSEGDQFMGNVEYFQKLQFVAIIPTSSINNFDLIINPVYLLAIPVLVFSSRFYQRNKLK